MEKKYFDHAATTPIDSEVEKIVIVERLRGMSPINATTICYQ